MKWIILLQTTSFHKMFYLYYNKLKIHYKKSIALLQAINFHKLVYLSYQKLKFYCKKFFKYFKQSIITSCYIYVDKTKNFKSTISNPLTNNFIYLSYEKLQIYNKNSFKQQIFTSFC